MISRALLIWFVLLAFAVANGVFREVVLTPRMRAGVAHAVSTVSLALLILLVGWTATPWIAPQTIQDAWTVGVLWVLLTIGFEFLGGHFIFGRSWEALLADYNLFAGKIWVMVLVVTLMTPVVSFTQRGS